MRNKILLTGATGFLGSRFVEYNSTHLEIVTVNLRKTAICDIDLKEVKAVVHMAGLAHQMKRTPSQAYFNINTDITKELAMHSKQAGVQQFIYLSSVKVYGEGSSKVITEKTACAPKDDYGKSKFAAEEYLKKIEDSAFKVAIVRPPLIFGPHVKGNMLRLMGLVEKNALLPFRGVNNKRSMVFVDNLVAFINAIIIQQQSGVFLPAETAAISTEELIRLIEKAFNKTSRLVQVPKPFIFLFKLTLPSLYKRLYGSFVLDNKISNSILNFVPPYSTETGILEMVKWYKTKNNYAA